MPPRVWNTIMLKIKLVVVGNLKESYFREMTNEYLKRIQKFAKIEVKEVPEQSTSSAISIEKIKEIESKNVLNEIEGFSVLLDRNGENLTSEEFASFFNKKQIQGVSKITFVIGGSYGISEEVQDRFDMLLSFGKMTFPHQLMRVILVEQIYRAMTILNKVQYHK